MTASAILGVFVALGAVLALLLVTLRALQRLAPHAGTGRSRLPLEVVQRLPLGPKQGIAVVRVGGRVLAIGVGEGGVRPIAELEGADRDAVLTQAPMPHVSSAGALAGVAAVLGSKAGLRAAASRTASLALLALALGMPSAAWGQVAARAPLTTAPAAPAQPAPPTALAPLPARTQNALVQAATRQTAGAPAAGATSAAPLPPGPSAPPPATPAVSAPSAPAAPSVTPVSDPMIARLAPTMDVRIGGGKDDGLRLSGTVGVVVMMGLMTLLPTLILMMTGFTRILVVLQFLKQAIGAQSAPPNQLVAALALLITGFVMTPTLREVNTVALQPWLGGKIEQVEMLERGARPLREFMLRQTRDRDLQTFVELSQPQTPPKTIDEVPLVVVMSAFVTSELRTAFQLGFALFLPFIVIDVVVSSVLMSMGMFMLPPAMIALPFKLLLFVLVDGWTLVIQSLVQSFR
jgi:flagellar biosynthetic protein FliP